MSKPIRKVIDLNKLKTKFNSSKAFGSNQISSKLRNILFCFIFIIFCSEKIFNGFKGVKLRHDQS